MNCFLWTEASVGRNKLTTKHEPLQPFLFLSFLEFAEAEVVLDVGANIGLYSMVATMANSVKVVYAYEPDKSAYEELQKNVLLNGVDNIVKPIQAAVSDVEGQVRFGSHSAMSGVNGIISTSIHDPAVFSESMDVTAVSLDRLEGIAGKVLGIKIDVEGHELQVIDGAASLLKKNPSVIQVEHYVGSGIDEKLRKLGYYQFFTAGHDHYFTNIRNFTNPLFIKQALEYAATWLIESNSGRWPEGKTIQSALSVSCKIDNDVIDVTASLHGNFFSGDVEYAFYLMVNGVKAETQWYGPEPSAQFAMIKEADSIEIKGFVREKHFPEKKVVVGNFIKQRPTGYRAKSAVDDARDLPSQYMALLGRTELDLGYPEVSLSAVLQNLMGQQTGEIIQLGGHDSALEIAKHIHTRKKCHFSVICTPAQQALIIKSARSNGIKNIEQWLTLYSVTSANDLKKVFTYLAPRFSATTAVVLRDQFLADIEQPVNILTPLFNGMPSGSKIYAEVLANASHRKNLSALVNENGLLIEWLHPQSTILPAKWIVQDSNKLIFNKETVSHTNQCPERALGLNFSLQDTHYKG
ncbi:FkbM family methyltransferase [Zobellella denitrificans]